MATLLNKTVRRELELDGVSYTLKISPAGIHLARKGHRKGHELSWRDLLSGEAELTAKLMQSLHSRREQIRRRRKQAPAPRTIEHRSDSSTL
jgi:hypothetical protein